MTVSSEDRRVVRRLLLFGITLVAAAVVFGSAAAKSAFACATGYWTVGCQYYSYQEGHSVTNQNGDSYEDVYTTFTPSNLAVRAIWTTAGGSWLASQELTYGTAVEFFTEISSDKNGCYNDHTQTMFINCRAGDGF